MQTLLCILIIFVTNIVYCKRRPLQSWELGDPPIDMISWMCIKRLKAGKYWNKVSSEGYPELVETKNTRCSWLFQAPKGKRVKLSFQAMHLRSLDPAGCPDNYVLVIDDNMGRYQQRLCGRRLPEDIVSSKNTLRVDFQIDMANIGNSKGFSFNYKYTKEKAGFYSRNSPDKAAQEKSAEKNAAGVATPKRLDKYEKKETDSKGTNMTAIIVSLVVIVCLLVIAWFVLKRYKKQKSKQKKSNDNAKTETTDDADLPNNLIDPFERIDAVCALPPPYEQIEKENVYVNYNPDTKNAPSQKNQQEIPQNQKRSRKNSKRREENKSIPSPPRIPPREEPTYRCRELPYEYGSSYFSEVDERSVYPPSRPRAKSRRQVDDHLNTRPYKDVYKENKNYDAFVRPSLRKSRNSRTRSSNISWNL